MIGNIIIMILRQLKELSKALKPVDIQKVLDKLPVPITEEEYR